MDRVPLPEMIHLAMLGTVAPEAHRRALSRPVWCRALLQIDLYVAFERQVDRTYDVEGTMSNGQGVDRLGSSSAEVRIWLSLTWHARHLRVTHVGGGISFHGGTVITQVDNMLVKT